MIRASSSSQREINHRRLILWLLVLMGISVAYFENGVGSGNSTTRLALSLAIVERGALTIDPLAEKTNDKARLGEHYYADKAPGISLLAVPVVALALPLFEHSGRAPVWFEGSVPTLPFAMLQYLVELFVSVFPLVLAVLFLYETALLLKAGATGALFAALAFGLGTPAWGWATTIFGHSTSAAFQFLALAAILHLDRNDSDANSARKLALSFLAGLLLGYALVVEFIAAISAAMIALYGLRRLVVSERGILPVSSALSAMIGGLVGITPLLIYNKLAFGSPFTLGYTHVVGFDGMKEGFYGIGLPDAKVAFAVLFGEYRGILWISPILLATPWAIFHLFKERWDLATLILGLSAYYVLVNAGYYYWDGGWSTGPRHITPILPFLCLPLAFLWRDASRRTRFALAGLLALSIALSLLCACVGMTAGPSPRLLLDYLFPEFKWGDWSGILLFQLKVLPPELTLLPLLLIWLALALLWWSWVSRRADAS